MPTYEDVLMRANQTIKDDWTRQHIQDFVRCIPSFPGISTVHTPRVLGAAVQEIEQAQLSGGRRSVIDPSWGAYPLVAKIASQGRAAIILEDSLTRVENVARSTQRMRDYGVTLRRLGDPDPTNWMPALVEVSVLGACERNGYRFRPLEPMGRGNLDFVLLTPDRDIHLDCLCITRTMKTLHHRLKTRSVVPLSVDPEVDLVLGKIRGKSPQLRRAGSVPRGVVVAYSGFGPEGVTSTMGILEAINDPNNFSGFSVFGVANGTAATGVMWFQNPRAEIRLEEGEWKELTKVFPGIPVRPQGSGWVASWRDVIAAQEVLADLDFRFLYPHGRTPTLALPRRSL